MVVEAVTHYLPEALTGSFAGACRRQVSKPVVADIFPIVLPAQEGRNHLK